MRMQISTGASKEKKMALKASNKCNLVITHCLLYLH